MAILLSSCASQTEIPVAGTSVTNMPDLACAMASNCVSSLQAGSLAPLRYTGTPAQALAILQAALNTFPEARVARSEALALEVVFSTPAGFKDQVDFSIDPQGQRIDFRSRSLFGLFDWGKNRARMQAFAIRFEQPSRR